MTESPPRIEVFLRSLAPTDARSNQEEILERLQELDQADRIAGYEVVLCGDCVCPSLTTAQTDVGERLLRRYESFESWAEAHNRTLDGFEERDTKSMLTGTSITGVTFPRLTIAEYRDGSLAFVAPSRNGVEQTTVRDRLTSY